MDSQTLLSYDYKTFLYIIVSQFVDHILKAQTPDQWLVQITSRFDAELCTRKISNGYQGQRYLFPTLTSISWICWAFPKSITAQQIGSGMNGLELGAVTLGWTAVASFLSSPLTCPFYVIVNVFLGYTMVIYILFRDQGQTYNISAIVNEKFEIDLMQYDKQGRIHLSTFFALSNDFGFATVASVLTHVAFFHGREIYEKFRASYNGKEYIHTRLMKRYKQIPPWWFYLTLEATVATALLLCIFLNDQVQMPWWGLLLASAVAFVFTLPISIITATTNWTPGLNIIAEHIMGVILPGKPIANTCFKIYCHMSMAQAVSFLSDFKLELYMKIPPRSKFLVQLIGTIVAGTINLSVGWWLLNSIDNICQDNLQPDSPWTCPGDRVFFDASVIGWDLKESLEAKETMVPLIGSSLVVQWDPFWSGYFTRHSLTDLGFGATASMPPATPLNYNSWKWWQRYNYILSAAFDAGVAFMAVLIYLLVGMENKGLNWWGTKGEHCELAICPTDQSISTDSCPVN
ncbi:LOW QUALITY PROTEIN: Oligopeptide transporter, OPT superfamily [Dillenia turbinata]|uniref:Oligopeptide transporter, OPT superfamily n=1 Tax=Dillenia turbinata TaxID=194707 RepID=A0AAN8WCM6_9MAGN